MTTSHFAIQVTLKAVLQGSKIHNKIPVQQNDAETSLYFESNAMRTPLVSRSTLKALTKLRHFSGIWLKDTDYYHTSMN